MKIEPDEENCTQFFYDFDNEHIWEIALIRSNYKTRVEVSNGAASIKIDPRTKRVIYEGDMVFPNWVYSLSEIKKRYQRQIIEVGIIDEI